jgi:Flp pilus assembly secretin CpaC
MRALVLTVLAALSGGSAAASDQVWLTMDQVKPYQMKAEVDQIVVGNPGIADVTVRDRSRVLLFGKAPGVTNMYLFDADGNEIDNLIVRVRSASTEMLTLQRGGQRLTLNCMSTCEPTLTVGDAQDSFGATQTQVQQKFEQAKSAAGASTGQ